MGAGAGAGGPGGRRRRPFPRRSRNFLETQRPRAAWRPLLRDAEPGRRGAAAGGARRVGGGAAPGGRGLPRAAPRAGPTTPGREAGRRRPSCPVVPGPRRGSAGEGSGRGLCGAKRARPLWTPLARAGAPKATRPRWGSRVPLGAARPGSERGVWDLGPEPRGTGTRGRGPFWLQRPPVFL